ncbi:hypothetical protein AMECASPLE_002257 [Ameca splendens]|uniref:Uncharacterized protein n=1 Tax=Ameca splendens TaxID=208324 RepID=A0ABV0Z737_9TELE
MNCSPVSQHPFVVMATDRKQEGGRRRLLLLLLLPVCAAAEEEIPDISLFFNQGMICLRTQNLQLFIFRAKWLNAFKHTHTHRHTPLQSCCRVTRLRPANL